MLDLESAIEHAEKAAKWQYTLYDCYLQHGEQGDYVQNCSKCADEHRQLAEWLKDYKRLKEQEPFMYKPCVANQICHEDKVKALGKIRAEIEEKYGDYDICEWFEDYDYEENDISEYWQVGKVSDILEIIDKYRGESEI